MARRDEAEKISASEPRVKKRGKRKREPRPERPDFVRILASPPVANFHCELVVGNGIGEGAVADALEAFRKATDVRRRKALDTAQEELSRAHPGAAEEEFLIVGPFLSPQDWRIDTDATPMTATTWCWVGYQSIRFPKA